MLCSPSGYVCVGLLHMLGACHILYLQTFSRIVNWTTTLMTHAQCMSSYIVTDEPQHVYYHCNVVCCSGGMHTLPSYSSNLGYGIYCWTCVLDTVMSPLVHMYVFILLPHSFHPFTAYSPKNTFHCSVTYCARGPSNKTYKNTIDLNSCQLRIQPPIRQWHSA